MEIIVLLPFLLGAWLANVGEYQKGARYMMLIILSLINAMLGLMGMLLLVAAQTAAVAGAPLPPELSTFNFQGVGLAVLFTGLAAFVPLVPPVRRLLARVIPINPDSLVHTTAMVYSFYLVGSTLATWPIIDVLAENEELAEQTLGQLGLADAWLNGLFFAALAFVGVGLFVRRDWPATLERLKVGRLTGRQIGIVVVTVFTLLAIEIGISKAWQTLDPAGYEKVGGLTEIFISAFLSPIGALTVGLAAGIGEELLFRGALQPRFGIFLTTLLFTFAHAQYSLSPALIAIFVVGYVLGIIRNRINTTAAILVHAGFNFVQVIAATYLGT